MIYYVEDDASIRELVLYTLRTTGFDAKGFGDGGQFLKELKAGRVPELVLLDIMLADEDGISILRRIKREYPDIPVIMVTAKGTEYDKITGLDAGADDYVSKPFGMMELVSRIKAVLRRTYRIPQSAGAVNIGNVSLDVKRHTVKVGGETVELTLKEFALLHTLMKNAGAVLTRDELLEIVWGYDACGETRTVDVHIKTLRRKLGQDGDIIRTVRGVGYKIG